MTKFGGLEDCIVMKVSPLFFFLKKRYRLYAYDPASSSFLLNSWKILYCGLCDYNFIMSREI
jgi:hypothetical protein